MIEIKIEKEHLSALHKEKASWKHGFGTKPGSPARFELYGGFERAGTSFAISIMKDGSVLAAHQNGSRAIIAPSATYEAAIDLIFTIADFWQTGKNNKNKRG